MFFLLPVLPAIPSNIHFLDISSAQARVTWELTNQNEDDLPDNITVQLYFKNGTLSSEYIANGIETELVLDLTPGTEYDLEMVSANVDGDSGRTQDTFKSVVGRKCTN